MAFCVILGNIVMHADLIVKSALLNYCDDDNDKQLIKNEVTHWTVPVKTKV